jgi:hypothetical protein
VNVPAYISEPVCGRYYVDSNKEHFYDTDNLPARLYPLGGNRYTVGHDSANQGGDVWAADAAIDVMENEDWRGLFVTLPGLDKAAHMWGGEDDPGAGAFPNGDPSTHLEESVRVADEQVGRITAALEDSGQLEDTLVVLTSDHGQMSARTYLGNTEDGPGGFPADPRGYDNRYYADTPIYDYLNPSDWIKPLVDTGNVGVSFQDSAIRVWLKDTSAAEKAESARIVSGMEGVMATYSRDGDRFRLVSRLSPEELTVQEQTWFAKHGQEIVDTSAAEYGADVIGLLRDHTTAGVAGDHGGAQYEAQNIPVVFYGAGTSATDSGAPIRSVDIMHHGAEGARDPADVATGRLRLPPAGSRHEVAGGRAGTGAQRGCRAMRQPLCRRRLRSAPLVQPCWPSITTTERSTRPLFIVAKASSTWWRPMRSETKASSGRRPAECSSSRAGKSRSGRQSPYQEDFRAPPRPKTSRRGTCSCICGVGTPTRTTVPARSLP